LEHILDTAIWALAGIEPPLGAGMTAQMIGIRPRCLAIIALHTHLGHPAKTRRAVTDFMNNSSALSDNRNRLVHDPWILERTKGETGQFLSMPKGELIFGFKAKAEREIGETLEKIARYITRAIALRDQIISEIHTLAQTPA
jgi:hypothetical protein